MWSRHGNSSSSSIHSGRPNSSSASGSGGSGVSKNGGNNNTSGSSGVEGSAGTGGSSLILGGNSYGFMASPGGVPGSFGGGSSTSNLASSLGGTGTGSSGNRHHTGAHPPHGASRALSNTSPLRHSHHPHPLSHAGEHHHLHHFIHSGPDGSGGSGGGNLHSSTHFSGLSSTHVKPNGHHPPVHTNHTGHTSSTPLPMGSGSGGGAVVGGSPTYNSSLTSPSLSVPGMGGPPPERPHELCKYFINGGCVRGALCPFSHSVPDERHLDVNKVGFILHPNVQNAQKAVPTSVSSPSSSSHNTSALQNPVSGEAGFSTTGSTTGAGVSTSSFPGYATVSPAPSGVVTLSSSPTSLSGHLGTDLTSSPIFYPAFFPPSSNTSVSGSTKGFTNPTLKPNPAIRTATSDANKGNPPMVSVHSSVVIPPDTAQLLSKFSDNDSLPTTIGKSTPPPRYRPPEPFLEQNLPPALALSFKSRTKEMEMLFLRTVLNGDGGLAGDSSSLSSPPSGKSTGLHPSTGTGVAGSTSAAALSTNSVASVESSAHSGGVPVPGSNVGNGSGSGAQLRSNRSSTVTSNSSGSVSFSPSSLLTVGGTGTNLSSSPQQQHSSYYAALTGGLGLKKGSFSSSVEPPLPSSPQSTTLVGV